MDIMGLMKQAKGLQDRMQALQSELDAIEVEGVSGGGLVRVTMTAKGTAKQIAIDASLVVPDEKEILEDLVLAAFNDARAKAERTMQDKMSALTAGLPLPPGLKLF